MAGQWDLDGDFNYSLINLKDMNRLTFKISIKLYKNFWFGNWVYWNCFN